MATFTVGATTTIAPGANHTFTLTTTQLDGTNVDGTATLSLVNTGGGDYQMDVKVEVSGNSDADYNGTWYLNSKANSNFNFPTRNLSSPANISYLVTNKGGREIGGLLLFNRAGT